MHHLPDHHLRRAGAQAPRPDVPGDGGAPGGAADGVAVAASRGRSCACCRGAPRPSLRLIGIRGGPSRSVTEEEIAASLEEGLDAGVIEAQEHQMVRNVFRLDERQIGSMMIPRADDHLARRRRRRARTVLARHRRERAFALPGVPRRARRRARHRLARRACCSRRCRARAGADREPRAAGVRARDAVGHGAARALPRRERAARVRGRRVRRGAGRDHRARRARGDHRRVQHADRRGRVGGAARRRQLADGRADPGARAEGPARPEGAARRGPRPLQHAGRHGHAAARPPAARPPTRSNGRAGASRSSTSTASASTRCWPMRLQEGTT